MGPKKAKELLKAALARQIEAQKTLADGEVLDFVEYESQLPPPIEAKRTRYIESLTLGREGFILTPGSALMNQMGSSKTKALDLDTAWESPVKF
jgi:hypothetical protein